MGDPIFVDSRKIELPKGQYLEIEMTQEFIDKLVIYFNLTDQNELSDEHIRRFVWGSLNNALDKIEEK